MTLNNLQIINPITYPGWDEMLLRTPGASFFHSSAWAGVLAESYGYTPLYFTIIENGKLRALVPMMEVNSFLTGKRGVSLPFTDYCEPIVGETNEFVVLFNRIIEYGKKKGWKYVELRGGERYLRSQESGGSNLSPESLVLGPGLNTDHSFIPQPATHNDFSPTRNSKLGTRNIFPCVTYLGHTLDLTKGEENIFSNLRDSTRRNIKKARNQGVDVSMSRGAAGIREFCRLNCLTRKEHGLPPQPYRFFQKVYNHIISKGLGFVTLASHQGQNIAAAVFFHIAGTAIHKYGASDKRFQEFRANNLVMWEAIRWFCNNGYKNFSFGRTELENKGLQQFKAGWGAEEYSINYFKHDLRRDVFLSNNKNPGRAARKMFLNPVFRRLPMPFLNLAGSVLYRHMG